MIQTLKMISTSKPADNTSFCLSAFQKHAIIKIAFKVIWRMYTVYIQSQNLRETISRNWMYITSKNRMYKNDRSKNYKKQEMPLMHLILNTIKEKNKRQAPSSMKIFNFWWVIHKENYTQNKKYTDKIFSKSFFFKYLSTCTK